MYSSDFSAHISIPNFSCASSFQEILDFQFARMDELRRELRELQSWTRTREENSREVANRLTSKVCVNGLESERHYTKWSCYLILSHINVLPLLVSSLLAAALNGYMSNNMCAICRLRLDAVCCSNPENTASSLYSSWRGVGNNNN